MSPLINSKGKIDSHVVGAWLDLYHMAYIKFLLGTSLGIPFWGLRVVQKVCQVYGLGSAKWIATVACHELEQ